MRDEIHHRDLVERDSVMMMDVLHFINRHMVVTSDAEVELVESIAIERETRAYLCVNRGSEKEDGECEK